MIDLLVPIDFSDTTPAVLDTASTLAKAMQARLVLMHVHTGDSAVHRHQKPDAEQWQVVHVAPKLPASLSDQGHASERPVHLACDDDPPILHKQAQLQRHEDQLKSAGLKVTAILVSGKPAERILEESARVRPAMIVIGSHGHGALRHLMVGSVSEAIIRKTCCPVVIVPCRRD